MDGGKAGLRDSIQGRLSLGLFVAILAVAVLAGVFSFVTTFDDVNEAQDDTLRQIAMLFARQGGPAAGTDAVSIRDGDDDSRVVVQRLGGASPRGEAAGRHLANGARANGARARLAGLPADLPDGMLTRTVDGRRYRILTATADGGVRFAVAQATDVRDDIAWDSALRTLIPFAVLVFVLLLVVADLVRRSFAPVTALAAALDRRAEDDLDPVPDAGLPAELRPFVVAINRLLGRVGRTLEAQRRFVADAAHELRSPLTALSLQAEGLAATTLPDPARTRLAALQGGIARHRALLEQLLALARAQMAGTERHAVSVHAVFREVLEMLLPLAEAKAIDIGVAEGPDARLATDRLALTTLVKNLVDNAIRYTPAGGRIDLSVSAAADGVTLRVADTGPGIEAAERARVFDPFHRVLGSGQSGAGLGLAIVRAIAERLGARVTLGAAGPDGGLLVTVWLPSGTPNGAPGEAPGAPGGDGV